VSTDQAARAAQTPPEPSPGGTGGIWTPERRPLTIGLVLAVTLVAFEALAIATVLPVVSRDLGDLRLYGWVFSAFMLSSLIGIVVAGTLADRVPLGRPMLAGLGLFAAGLVIGGTAPSMEVLVAGRAVQGLGAGVVPAVAYVAISRGYPDGCRPRMFAVLSTAWVIPGLIGPAIAALVAAAVGWRWVFLGLLPLVAVAGLLSVVALRAVPRPDRAARPVEQPAERTRVRVKVQAADEPGFEVVRLGDSFLIMGEKPRRWVQQTDFGNDEAVGYLADRLARLGVEEALAEAGAEPGAEVLIGDLDDAVVFDWDPAAPMASGASGPGKRGGHAKGKQHLGPRGTDPRLTP